MQLISSEAQTGDAELTTVPEVELESFKFLHLSGCFYIGVLFSCFINMAEEGASMALSHGANVMLRLTSSMRVDASKLL